MIGNAAIRWLLGLERVAPDAAGARFAWEHPFPAWAAAVAAALALGAAWLSYRRIDVPPARRRILAGLRATALLFLAALIAGPSLEVPRESVDPDSVMVLADRSRSMAVEDVPCPDGSFRSRDTALRALAAPDGPFAGIGPEHRVEWMGFADGAAPLVREGAGAEVGEASGDRTLLASAIERALDRSSGRAVAAVVLLTDGRTTEPPDRSLVRRLQSEGVAVSSIALGAPAALGDSSVTAAQAPPRAFPRDIVPVEATVERRGPARGRAVRAELVDLATGTVLDAAELPPAPGDGASRESVQLVAKPAAAGDARWEVRVGTPGVARDLVPANDRRQVSVTLVDRPLRVLYVEGYPRWEYRYLKNLLQREQSTESAVMLLSADRDFAQEGNTPIARLPRTREEFSRFDLFVLGDIPASFFTAEQLMELRSSVADRGAGLVWIGGERSMPRTWKGSALEELLPFRGSFELERAADPVHLRPTPLAARLGVLRLGDDPKAGFPEELGEGGARWSALEWAQRIPPGDLKPTAEVLAESSPAADGTALPLVVSLRYGAGNAVYVATDEVWRWRHGRGESYPERFWVQILRSLARPSLGSGREEVRVLAEPGRVSLGEPVRVEVELPDGAPPATVQLEAVAEDPSQAPQEFEAMPMPGGAFAGRWVPESEGRWTIRPRDPSLAARAGRGASVESVRSDRELRDAEADRALLESLARETGGRVVGPDDARSLVETLPNRSVRTDDPVRDPLRPSPAALIVACSLFVAEWALRRTWRLA